MNTLSLALLLVSSQTAPTYSKRVEMVPMRDGTKLYTQIYTPKDWKGQSPILMERTPYGAGPGGDTIPRGFGGSPKLAQNGYIFVFQDVRGQNESEGKFENIRPRNKPGMTTPDEVTDTYDTIEWLLKNVPGNNGKVGMWGISYPGFYAGIGATCGHPALAAVSPQAPCTDWFLGDDDNHNGAFFLQDNFDFSQFFDLPAGVEPPRVNRGQGSAYDFFLGVGPLKNFGAKVFQNKIPYWNEIVSNDRYNDYWKDRSLLRNFGGVKCAMLFVGGFFDAENLYGALNGYVASETKNPGIVNQIAMGPWSHGMWAGGPGSQFAGLKFGQDTGTYFREEIEFPFFEKHLRGVSAGEIAEATVFETGSNKWHKLSVWPPKVKLVPWYLGGDKRLSLARPAKESVLKYTADPAAPTPYEPNYKTSRRRPSSYMAADQTFAAQRNDVLTFRSEPLTSDVQAAGPIWAKINFKTTGTDADIVVKLIDEYPADANTLTELDKELAGKLVMVRGNVMRAKFRKSMENPSALSPGKVESVNFNLNETMHTFRKGHRIVVQVQSYWFPLVDRNPNKFMSIGSADEKDYKAATISVITGGPNASSISFGPLP